MVPALVLKRTVFGSGFCRDILLSTFCLNLYDKNISFLWSEKEDLVMESV